MLKISLGASSIGPLCKRNFSEGRLKVYADFVAVPSLSIQRNPTVGVGIYRFHPRFSGAQSSETSTLFRRTGPSLPNDEEGEERSAGEGGLEDIVN